MEPRYRYAIGALAIPLLIGGITVLVTNPDYSIWAYVLFGVAALSLIWGIWPLLIHNKKSIDAANLNGIKILKSTKFSQEDAQEIYEKVNELLRQLVDIAPQIRAEIQNIFPSESFYKDVRYIKIKNEIDKAMEKCYDKELDNRLCALTHIVAKMVRYGQVPQDVSFKLDRGHKLIREHIAKLKRREIWEVVKEGEK